MFKDIYSPIFDWHDVVQDGVDGGGEVVEAARDVEELLIDDLLIAICVLVFRITVETRYKVAIGLKGKWLDLRIYAIHEQNTEILKKYRREQ